MSAWAAAEDRGRRITANLAALPSVAEVAAPIVRALHELVYAGEALANDVEVAADQEECAVYSAWVLEIAEIVGAVVSQSVPAAVRDELGAAARRIVYVVAGVDGPRCHAWAERGWDLADKLGPGPWRRYDTSEVAS